MMFRQSCEFLSNVKLENFPEYNDLTRVENNRADYRNTLYWDPEIHTSAEGTTTVDFYTSDETAHFVIVISGLTEEGYTCSWEGDLYVTEK